MLTHERAGWLGEFEIVIKHRDGTIERQQLRNRLTDAALDMLRDALAGDLSDAQIKYLALGDDGTALDDTDTTLGNENFRVAFQSPVIGTTGKVEHITIVLDTEAVFHIREIGVFAGAAATSAPDSGILVSRVLWDRDKTNLESIQFVRTDTIGRA